MKKARRTNAENVHGKGPNVPLPLEGIEPCEKAFSFSMPPIPMPGDHLELFCASDCADVAYISIRWVARAHRVDHCHRHEP